jgi:magnesium transporter
VERQAILFRPGGAPEINPSQDRIDAARGRSDHLVWIDLIGPSTAEIDAVASEFGFHPLAREDAHHRRQRPKLDQYGDDLFIVFYAFALDSLHVSHEEIHIYVSQNVLVTMSDRPLAAIVDVRKRWCSVPPNENRSPGMLLYALLDSVVDDYFPVIDHLSELLDDAQEQIFETPEPETQQHIFSIIRTLLAARRILGPQRDVMNALVRRDTPIVEPSMIPYFQDVYDHILRVSETIDTYREYVAAAIDVQLSATSNRLNEVMKRMTGLSIILMSVTLVASIYGMNFVNMPELDWAYGYPLALGLMVAIGAALYLLFRRSNYL